MGGYTDHHPGKAKIYTLAHPETGEVRYVGMTTGPVRHRFRTHISLAQNGQKTYKASWIQGLLNEGLEPEVEILELVEPARREQAERFWIGYLRFIGCRLVNLTPGGDGWPAGKSREKGRRAQSESMRERWREPGYRERVSASISEALKGREMDEQWCLKLSRSHASVSEEKIVAAVRDYVSGDYTQKEAAERHGISAGVVNSTINGRSRESVLPEPLKAKAKLVAQERQRTRSEKTRRRMAEAKRGTEDSPETREKKAKAQEERYEDPQEREKTSRAMKEYWAKVHAGEIDDPRYNP